MILILIKIKLLAKIHEEQNIKILNKNGILSQIFPSSDFTAAQHSTSHDPSAGLLRCLICPSTLSLQPSPTCFELEAADLQRLVNGLSCSLPSCLWNAPHLLGSHSPAHTSVNRVFLKPSSSDLCEQAKCSLLRPNSLAPSQSHAVPK